MFFRARIRIELQNVIGRTIQNVAEFFKGEHGDVLILFEGIESLIVNSLMQKIVLGDPFSLHGFP